MIFPLDIHVSSLNAGRDLLIHQGFLKNVQID